MGRLVILPTYNEADNIAGVIRAVRRVDPEIHVLVVDDSSPDGTAQIVASVAAEVARVDLLNRPGKQGLGSAYRAGFGWGLERGFDILIEMDSDFSHDPDDLSRLIRAIEEGADLAVGSRYVPGGSIPDWTFRRRALSRAGNRYARILLGIDVADMTSGFRAYRSSLLAKIDLDSVTADGYGFQIEMVRQAVRAGGTVVEVPIAFSDRVRGQSKMSGWIIVEALKAVTWWGVQDRMDALRQRRSGSARPIASRR